MHTAYGIPNEAAAATAAAQEKKIVNKIMSGRVDFARIAHSLYIIVQ